MVTLKIIKILVIISISLLIISCGGNMKTATFKTTEGNFKIELFTNTMPITTENFIKLANNGFYDNTKFHRVIPEFMIQGGDPLSKDDSKKHLWGTGDPGYKIKDEFAGPNKNVVGTISMANAGPNTGGSQFFINVANNNFLDGKHPVFGKVIEGMDIVEKISTVATGSQDKPIKAVVIEKVTIK
jgi:peptidylprolyl isomerase